MFCHDSCTLHEQAYKLLSEVNQIRCILENNEEELKHWNESWTETTYNSIETLRMLLHNYKNKRDNDLMRILQNANSCLKNIKNCNNLDEEEEEGGGMESIPMHFGLVVRCIDKGLDIVEPLIRGRDSWRGFEW